jgi:hypothetical protein
LWAGRKRPGQKAVDSFYKGCPPTVWIYYKLVDFRLCRVSTGISAVII